MTDEELKELVASLSRGHSKMDQRMEETRQLIDDNRLQMKETDRRMKETDQQIKETGRQIKELGRQLGGLGNKFGSFTEGLALPSMTKILSDKFGMTTINPSVRVKDRAGHAYELDVLAYANGENNRAFIVEVKSHLREESIQQLLQQLAAFPRLFPELADKALYGILTAVDASEALKQKVLEQGLYFAEIHDEQFSLNVPDDFIPRRFH
jgi:hypothetical protein